MIAGDRKECQAATFDDLAHSGRRCSTLFLISSYEWLNIFFNRQVQFPFSDLVSKKDSRRALPKGTKEIG